MWLLLGRPRSHSAAHPAPAEPLVLGGPDVAGRGPEPQWLRRRCHGRPDPVDRGDSSTAITEQLIPGGLVASREAVNELGTNGGGFYNANSAHPFSNPNSLSNILQIWALLLIPFGFVVAFGRLRCDRGQGRVLMAVMVTILVLLSGFAMLAEQQGNPGLTTRGADQSLSVSQPSGNMEGKKTRFGPAASGLSPQGPRGPRRVL